MAQSTAFHVMTKPIGPICNLDCKYCFYLEKEKLYPDERKWKMSDEVLDRYVRQYIEQQDAPEINFAWQGGEPTLLGVEFFRRAVELQKQYADGKIIHNAIQTNGTLLDDAWGAFLHENGFLVGLSIDGPRELHDAYRVDKQQRGTFDDVMRGLDVLRKHRVEYNTLTVVNRFNSQKPLDVYRFLRQVGSGFIQFIPLVERLPQTRLKVLGLDLAEPPVPGSADPDDLASPVTEWSVRARDYGEFLVRIFDEWVRRDVGRVFVQLFDVALGNWVGAGSSLCVFAEKCGTALAIEHNGDVYSCDHYVYPRYKLGNVINQSLGEMVGSEQQRRFGSDKLDTLPQYCRQCEVRFACNGECPKHRFIRTPDGEEGLNYLCPAYKRFFSHIDPYMRTMADLLRARQPAASIMGMLTRAEQDARPSKSSGPVGRNDPCPCGSGKKYKKCCGA
ncbi:MAG TPA: anaerobic sulfatase maturase [Tepidisphaeraceae bacterium]|nr:anaerobic sulfatase maturase [Tepidisphaeraceae bacterium]